QHAIRQRVDLDEPPEPQFERLGRQSLRSRGDAELVLRIAGEDLEERSEAHPAPPSLLNRASTSLAPVARGITPALRSRSSSASPVDSADRALAASIWASASSCRFSMRSRLSSALRARESVLELAAATAAEALMTCCLALTVSARCF